MSSYARCDASPRAAQEWAEFVWRARHAVDNRLSGRHSAQLSGHIPVHLTPVPDIFWLIRTIPHAAKGP